MKFIDFIKKGEARKGEKDTNLSKSLVATAKSDLEFFNRCRIDGNSARKIVSNYYDVLRSILEAIAALDGFKIYSHEAFTYFLIEKNERILAEKFDRFRRIRNSINYYGKSMEIEEAKEISEEIKQVIKILINKYLNEKLEKS